MLKTLQELSPGEKEILSSFKGNDTQWLSMENEYVTALHNKEVLTLASSIAKRMGRAFEQELSCQYRFDPLARELYRSLEHHQ
jgi:hypothetical protein